MPFVAILGAGPLGGALTHTLASRGRFDEVRLIDPSGTIAAGKALDVRQAGPCDGASTRVTGHAGLDAAAGAWVLVLADPLPTTESTRADELALVRQLTQRAPGALLVCARADAAPLLPGLVGSGSSAPDLLVGSAPTAVAGAARALIAAACDCSAQEVALTLDATTDPNGPAIDWTRVALRGAPASDVLSTAQRAHLDQQLARGWPPGPLALASAAARVAEAAWFGSRLSLPAWVVDRSLAPAADRGTAGTFLADVRFDPGGRLRRASAYAP